MLSNLAIVSASLLPITDLASTDNNANVYTSISALAYVEDNSVYDLVKGNEVDYTPSESAFAVGEYSLGTQYKSFAFSYFYRYEWFLGFTEDTMAFYETTVHESPLEPDKTYDIDLSVNHIHMQGLRLGYLYDLNDDINLYAAASYMKAKELMDGDITGHVASNDGCGGELECYTGNLTLDYTYTEDRLLKRKADEPTSKFGYGIDIGADWKINDDWFTSVYIQDLVSAIYWDHAPVTVMHANTATHIVEDGKYKIRPLMSGTELYHDYKQVLPIKYRALLAYNIAERHRIYVHGLHAYSSTLAHLGYDFAAGGTLYRFKYYPVEGAIGVELKNSIFNLSVTSDSIDYQKSTLTEIKLGISIPFL
ncbi:DUF5723 family protein [Vibrio sonorensis]|uniref:DUF5723 family protein n=1 Tax=Vibrio sonorensis TaxID=1004316 RepID=UPI0008D99441|nr:DUF5723 family protein [Vibrio sonorensis]